MSRLATKTGRPLGSADARRLRAAGEVPAVLYGAGLEPVHFSVNGRELRSALSGELGLRSIVTLDVEGTSRTVVAKEIQRHPVRHTVLHVDFLVVDEQEATAAAEAEVAAEAAAQAEEEAAMEAHAKDSMDPELEASDAQAATAESDAAAADSSDEG